MDVDHGGLHIAGEAGVSGTAVVTLGTPGKKEVRECFIAVPDAEDTTDTLSTTELLALTSAPAGFFVEVDSAEFPAGAVRGRLR